MFPHGRSVTIVRRPGTDEYGDPLPGPDVRVDIPGAAWAPRSQGVGPSSFDLHDRNRQGVVEGLTVFIPARSQREVVWPGSVPEADRHLKASDVLELGGVEFEFEGEVGDWWNPKTGREAGLEVAVRRAEG